MSETLPAADHRATAPLRLRSFRWYLASMVATMLANEIQVVSVGWQLYELTRDPLSLGFIGLAGAIPFMSTVLFAGHVADVSDRRAVAAVALGALFACTLALVGLSAGGVAASHPWTIYGVIIASGFARSFLMPARSALCSDIVPRAMLEVATRLRSSVVQLAAVVGRSLSGFIYAAGTALGLGATFSYAVAALLLVAAALAMLAVRSAPRQAEPDAAPQPMLRSLADGVSYVLSNRILLGAMVLDLLGVLFGDAIILLPVFAADILRIGPEGLGLLRAAPAVGAVLMSLVLARLPPFAHAGRVLLWAVACFGLTMVGFALSTSMVLSFILLLASGACDFISVVVRNTLIQVLTPPRLIGRVSAVQSVFVWSSNEIGAFESGAAARLLGLVPSVVVGGVVTVAVTAATAWRNPALRRLGRIRPPGEEPALDLPAAPVAVPAATPVP